jgi:hypothetical protein
MSLNLGAEHCERVAANHRQSMREAKAQSKGYVPADREFHRLMLKAEFHRIQASLWDKQAIFEKFGERR